MVYNINQPYFDVANCFAIWVEEQDITWEIRTNIFMLLSWFAAWILFGDRRYKKLIDQWYEKLYVDEDEIADNISLTAYIGVVSITIHKDSLAD